MKTHIQRIRGILEKGVTVVLGRFISRIHIRSYI